MPKLLEWGQIGPFYVAVQSGNVKGFIKAARKNAEAAEKLGLRAIALAMANPSDANRRTLWGLKKSWQGMSLKRLMRAFASRQAFADRRRHERRCLRSAQRVAADVVSA